MDLISTATSLAPPSSCYTTWNHHSEPKSVFMYLLFLPEQLFIDLLLFFMLKMCASSSSVLTLASPYCFFRESVISRFCLNSSLLIATFQPVLSQFIFHFHSTAKLISNSLKGQKEANCGTEPITPKFWAFHFVSPVS